MNTIYREYYGDIAKDIILFKGSNEEVIDIAVNLYELVNNCSCDNYDTDGLEPSKKIDCVKYVELNYPIFKNEIKRINNYLVNIEKSGLFDV